MEQICSSSGETMSVTPHSRSKIVNLRMEITFCRKIHTSMQVFSKVLACMLSMVLHLTYVTKTFTVPYTL